MRIVLALIQLIFMIIAFITEYRIKSPMVFCWGVLLVMFGGMHIVSTINIDYQYDSEVLNEASAFATLFCLIYIAIRIVGFMITSHTDVGHLKVDERMVISSDNIVSQVFVTLLDALLFISVIIYVAVIISESGGVIQFDKSIVYSAMEQHTKWMLISTYLYFSSAPVLLYHLYKRQPVRSAYAILLIVVKTTASLSRIDMVFIITAIVGYIVLVQKRKECITLLLLATMVVVFIYAMYALRVFRNLMMDPQYAGNVSSFSGKILDLIMRDDGDLGGRKVFYYFIQNDNRFEGFGTGAGYRRLLLFPLPSPLSGGLKPEDICITMGRAWKGPSIQGEGIVKYTMTPTWLGECYANFGFA